MTKEQQIINIVASPREFFETGITRQYQTRIECLQKLIEDIFDPEYVAFSRREEIGHTIRRTKSIKEVL
jgi:hypothetical protein